MMDNSKNFNSAQTTASSTLADVGEIGYYLGYICFFCAAICFILVAKLESSARPVSSPKLPADANMGAFILAVLLVFGIVATLSLGILMSALALFKRKKDWGLLILALLALAIFIIQIAIQKLTWLGPYSQILYARFYIFVGLALALPVWKSIRLFLARHRPENTPY